jgi:hypothetical protein
MRSMVEGARSAGDQLAPTTALRAVPLPRFAGEDMPAHVTFTLTVFVVSLPRMSITLTTIV